MLRMYLLSPAHSRLERTLSVTQSDNMKLANNFKLCKQQPGFAHYNSVILTDIHSSPPISVSQTMTSTFPSRNT